MKSKFKKVVLYALSAIGIVLAAAFIYPKFFLPDVAASPYLQVPVTQERIARGKYLANNVAVCMDCHSSRDWSRFSAPPVTGTLGKGGEYFGQEMGFPGKFYARNLTPSNLGNWTDGEIFRAITTGVSRDGHALFPVMPYPAYGKMDKEDVYDIIAYLRSLQPIPHEIPPSEADFPMSLIINTLPAEAQLTSKPDPENRVEYGRYLVNAAGCIDCHSPVKNGQVISEFAFSGGREFPMPNGILKSANITPDKQTGIGKWNEQDFLSRFKAYSNPETAVVLGENQVNTIMPWTMYAGMKTSDLRAIYAYLQTLKSIENDVAAL